MILNRERLEQTFGGPHLAWLIRRLRRRLEAGLDIQKELTLRNPAALERNALGRLLGRRMSRNGPISVRPSELEDLIRHAELANGLIDAVETLTGPVEDKSAKRFSEDNAWNDVFNEMKGCIPDSLTALDWVNELQSSALVRRLAKQDIECGRLLCREAAEIVNRLPASGTCLSEIAATATGDGHALDAGRPLSAMLLRLVSKLSLIEDWTTSEGRRSAWAGVGVLVDELSAPVLTLNLRSEGGAPPDRALNLHADIGEPYRISTRQLLRSGLQFTKSSAGPKVYVCENPTVVAAVANALGSSSAPLISIEGQPKTSAHILLLQLRRAGIEILYHGDFDWPGIQIANLVIRRYGAVPWRFGAEDYKISPAGIALRGTPVGSCWDPNLADEMIRRQSAVHEEAVLALLMKDLV